jgi:hypothetical protein
LESKGRKEAGNHDEKEGAEVEMVVKRRPVGVRWWVRGWFWW